MSSLCKGKMIGLNNWYRAIKKKGCYVDCFLFGGGGYISPD